LEHRYDGNAGLPEGQPPFQITETKRKSSTEEFEEPVLMVLAVRRRLSP